MYTNICIKGWRCESDQEVVFVSFVRACEAACACETMLFPLLSCGSSHRAPVCPAFRALLLLRVESMLGHVRSC